MGSVRWTTSPSLWSTSRSSSRTSWPATVGFRTSRRPSRPTSRTPSRSAPARTPRTRRTTQLRIQTRLSSSLAPVARHSFRNSLQADRAARREERRTKKLYRKAACKHKLSTWWKRYQTKPSDDYEEKRQMILEQEGILEDVMQNEIRNLQSASDFVRDIIRAEEGRARSDH